MFVFWIWVGHVWWGFKYMEIILWNDIPECLWVFHLTIFWNSFISRPELQLRCCFTIHKLFSWISVKFCHKQTIVCSLLYKPWFEWTSIHEVIRKWRDPIFLCLFPTSQICFLCYKVVLPNKLFWGLSANSESRFFFPPPCSSRYFNLVIVWNLTTLMQ